MLRILIELDTSSSSFNDQLGYGETKARAADIRRCAVAAGKEAVEDLGVLAGSYTWAFILNHDSEQRG